MNSLLQHTRSLLLSIHNQDCVWINSETNSGLLTTISTLRSVFLP